MKTFHYQPLNLPPARLRVEERDGRLEVFDPLRMKWLALTDEEWVRQHFTAFMTDALGYPKSVMANEVGLKLNRTQRRADTVVYGRDGKPLVIVEYKAPSVEITREVFDQIARYNMVLGARLLIVSNGLRHYCCLTERDGSAYRFLPDVPSYAEALEI